MLIRKFHRNIRLGHKSAIAPTGNPLFSRQGHWDGSSTLHCVAMALALLGKLIDPVYLPYHGNGPEQKLWDDAWPHYLSGMTLAELASFVADLNLGVRPATCTASGHDLLRFTQRELDTGWPVIIGWRQRHPVRWRAALVVGFEGRQLGNAFDTQALLLIDPAGHEPGFAGFNARLAPHNNAQYRYQSCPVTRSVALLGGVSIRDVVSAGADA